MNLFKEINQALEKYHGISTFQLKKQFMINSNSKSINSILINRILIKETSYKIAELKDQIIIKTISYSNGKIEQSMSFPYFDFVKLSKDNWETSDLFSLLKKPFIFCFFGLKDNLYTFDFHKEWMATQKELEEAKRVFNLTKNIISEGNIIKNNEDQHDNNFPKIIDSYFVHVRPHGRNSSDKINLPIHDKVSGNKSFSKQSFWINSSFLNKIFKL
jgi:hypothetical protein